MEQGVTIPIKAPVSAPGAEQAANSLQKVNLVAKDTSTTFYKLSNQTSGTGSKKLVNLLNQLESKKSVITRIMGNDTHFNESMQNLKKTGVFDMLPTSSKNTLQEYANLEKLVHQKRKPGRLIEGLDKTISEIKEIAGLTEEIIDDTKQIDTNNKDIGNKTDENTSKQKKFKQEISKTNTVVETLKKGFNGLEIVKLTYLFRSIRRVTSSWVEMVKSAAAYEESLNLYMMSFGKYAETAERWMTRITDALKLDPNDVMQYAGAFNNLLKGMGVTSDAAYVMSTNLTQLTYDMASYLNISNEAAQAKLQSAMAGQSRAVASVGVATQIASLQELAYSLNIKKKVSEMTQGEKTYLRYIQLMRSTTHMQGDLGKTMMTPANAIRTLENQIKMLGRAIGQVLTPFIMQAIPYIMAMTNVLTAFAKRLAEFFGYKITDVSYDLAFEDIGDALDDIKDKANGAGKSVKNSLAPFDELNQVMSESGSGSGGGGDDNVIPKLKEYITGYDMLKNYTGDLVKKAESLEDSAKGILTAIATIAGFSIISTAIIKIARLKQALETLGATPIIKFLLGNPLTSITAIIGGLYTLGEVSTGIVKDISKGLKLNELSGTEAPGWAKFIDKYVDMYTRVESIALPGIGQLARGFYESSKEEGQLDAFREYYKNRMEQLASENIFGTLYISTDEWLDVLRSAPNALDDISGKLDEFSNGTKLAFERFKDASDNVELLRIKFETLGNQISKKDAKKITDAVKDMCDNTKTMINNNIDYSLLLWGDTFKRTSVITEEEEQKILEHIKKYGEEQTKELNNAQNNITKTYDKAIKERGYLTDEERKYIEEQLDKIRELTENEMTENQANVIRIKTNLADESNKLDQKSYKEFNDALTTFTEEQEKIAKDHYNRAIIDANRYYDEDSEDYKKMIASAKADYEKAGEDTAGIVEKYRNEVYGDLVETYKKILNKTDTNSLLMKEKIEKILIDANIDPTSIDNFTGQFMDVGAEAVNSLKSGWQTEVPKASTSMLEKLRSALEKAWNANPISWALDKLGLGALKNPFAKFSGGGRGFATGGYPSSGDYFYMNENGRAEYMASIGNRTAVVNQDQMVQSLATVITNAMANLGFGNNQKGDTIVYIGNKKVYEGQGEYQNRENDRYGTNVVRV